MEEPTVEEIQKYGKIVSTNSYSCVYEYLGRYFRMAQDTWTEVVLKRSRFYHLKYLFLPNPPNTNIQESKSIPSQGSFLAQAVKFVPELQGGEIYEVFKSPGGIVKLEDKFFRVTYLHGMQEVREGFARWKTVSIVYESTALKMMIRKLMAESLKNS